MSDPTRRDDARPGSDTAPKPCARCDHGHEEHDRRDGTCNRGGVYRETPWQCDCPRFVWSNDVFTVEVDE